MKRIVTLVLCIAFLANIFTPGIYAWAAKTDHNNTATNTSKTIKGIKSTLLAQAQGAESSKSAGKTTKKKKRFFTDNASNTSAETTKAISANDTSVSSTKPVQAAKKENLAPKAAVTTKSTPVQAAVRPATPAQKATVSTAPKTVAASPVTVPNIYVKKNSSEKKQVAVATKPAAPVSASSKVTSTEKPATVTEKKATAPVKKAEPAPAKKTEPAPTKKAKTAVKPETVAQTAPATPAASPAPAAAPATPATPAAPADSQPAASPATTPAATPAASPAPASSPAPGGNETILPGAAKEENVRITAIEVRGNNTVPTSEVLAAVRTKVGDPILEPRIRSDVQSIYETGYFTDVKVDTLYFAGGIKIIFRVQENPIVSKITILGNKIVPLEKLRSLMQTQEGKILNMKTLSADMNEINYYYNESLGYKLEPTHIKNVNWTPQGELILTLQEGLEIKEVRVTGSSLFAEDRLQGLIQTKSGQLLNEKQLTEDAARITKFYEDEGYIPDTVRPIVDYRTGVVTLQVIEAVVEDIRIEFDKEKHKTKESTVLRNIRTKPGEVLQRNKLQRDIERLNNLGYFSRVNVDPEPGSKPGNVILVFRLAEQKTGLATIGVGYTGGGSGALRSGVTGAISFSEKNLGGTGQALSAAWQRGVNIDAMNVSYYNPAINKNQDSISLSIFRHNYSELLQPVQGTSITNPKYALYDDIRTGGSASYGRRITDDFRLFLSYRLENLEIRQNPKSLYPVTGISKGSLSALSLGALYDDRNDVFDPTTGAYVDASIAYAGRFMGGDYDFTRYQAEVRKYFPIGRRNRSTIAVRAWGGLIKGNAPITETFYVGGTDTIRGYPENAFYGTRMVVLNAEYRFPIGNIKYLKGAVFADAGNAWFPGQSSKLYKDVGAGLRIVFPTLGLGVIRVDFAVGDKRSRTSIGIGQTF